jgi:hypothetical protein
LAGHTAGAALDLFLCKDGQELPLGNTYGEGGASTAVQFPFITQEEWSTRMLFQLSAEAFGFAVYPFENWHISDGDVSRSIMSTQTIEPSFVARFGPVKNFDRETGKVILFPPAEISTPFYSQARILREINIR